MKIYYIYNKWKTIPQDSNSIHLSFITFSWLDYLTKNLAIIVGLRIYKISNLSFTWIPEFWNFKSLHSQPF